MKLIITAPNGRKYYAKNWNIEPIKITKLKLPQQLKLSL